jgi:hypothetical protein
MEKALSKAEQEGELWMMAGGQGSLLTAPVPGLVAH